MHSAYFLRCFVTCYFVPRLSQVLNEFTKRGGTIPSYAEEQVKKAVIGLARDIRGIAAAFVSRQSYNFLWFWLYRNNYTLMFVKSLELWPTDYRISVTVLKMLGELCNNKSSRICFEPGFADGYILFKEATKAFCTYCHHLLEALPASLRCAPAGQGGVVSGGPSGIGGDSSVSGGTAGSVSTLEAYRIKLKGRCSCWRDLFSKHVTFSCISNRNCGGDELVT